MLSRPLIAFTIEVDNEAAHRLGHRTTPGAAGGRGRGPVLLAFTQDFERESAVPLAIGANALRVLTRRRGPHPRGWRARKPCLRQATAMLSDPTGALPHYPMVLHSGGWPDGS